MEALLEIEDSLEILSSCYGTTFYGISFFLQGGYAILCAFFCNIWQESITFFLFLFVFISWSSSSWPFNLSTISNTHQCIAKWIRMLKISFDAKVRCHACVVVCTWLELLIPGDPFVGWSYVSWIVWCFLFSAGILCLLLGNSISWFGLLLADLLLVRLCSL